MKLQSLIKYGYAWNCVNNPTWKVSTFQRTDSSRETAVNNTMQLAFFTNHQYVPCVIITNTKRERTGYLRVFLINTNANKRDHARTRAASLENACRCIHVELNLLELPPVKPFISKCFTRKSFKALSCSCYTRNKALGVRPRC